MSENGGLLTVRTLSEGEVAQVLIRDTGVGMNPKRKPFYFMHLN
ncbi:MAG: hypothetical protein K0Q63_792 [Paenibacillus sp.]|nr:hypothetical protein [Paenibacillus sp.]